LRSRIEGLLEQPINVKSKEVRALIKEPARLEILEGLPERAPTQ
jgi:hypothetical protein